MATAFVDFTRLKEQVSIVQVMQMLGLKMKQQGSQYRGPCTACNQGGDRALAVNSEKNSFYCFAAKVGGDAISLCAHITGKSPRDAAQQIATHFKFVGNTQVPDTAPQAPQRKPSFDADAYLRTLDPAASQLSELGLSPETLTGWRAGYCKAGVNRGRLAIALCDREGNILGFCGRSLTNEPMAFPNGIDPHTLIFGSDRVQPGLLYLVRDPLAVLKAFENGIENVVSFLTEGITAQQLEQLASLLDQKHCEQVEMY